MYPLAESWDYGTGTGCLAVSLCRENFSLPPPLKTAMATTWHVLLSPEKNLNPHQFLGNGLHGHVYALCFLKNEPLWMWTFSAPHTAKGHRFLVCLEIRSHLESPQKYSLLVDFLFHQALIFPGCKIVGERVNYTS